MTAQVVVYSSNRYDAALATVKGAGNVIALTSDLARLLGIKIERPERQRELWEP